MTTGVGGRGRDDQSLFLLARSMLRHIRVTAKHELKKRLIAFIEDLNHEPIPHTWSYKIGKAA